MDGETNNLPSGGTDNAQPSEADNSAEWDYYDPEEDNVKTPEPAETDDEQDEAEGQESGEEFADDDEAKTEEPEPEEEDGKAVKDDVVVTLQDGTAVPLKELKLGYMRQADYTRGKQDVSVKAQKLEADSQRVARTIDAFADFMARSLPDEPNPALALSDPGKYVAQKAQYDAALAQVQTLIEMGGEPKSVVDGMTEAQKREFLFEENRKLADAFPMTKSDTGRDQFFSAAFEAAAKLGYSDAEAKAVSDHRLLGLAYWANVGMKAHAAREKAKAKVANVPPVAPQKQQPKVTGQVAKNREAMRKLSQSGSIKDALAVDWD